MRDELKIPRTNYTLIFADSQEFAGNHRAPAFILDSHQTGETHWHSLRVYEFLLRHAKKWDNYSCPLRVKEYERNLLCMLTFLRPWNKLSSEVQSCHYGQNPPNNIFHTGMFYTKHEKSVFCTISKSKRKDAAIWTYRDQILKDIHAKCPNVNTIHFWSDGLWSESNPNPVIKL